MNSAPRFALQPADGPRFRKWAIVTVVLFLLYTCFVWVHGFFSDKFNGITGKAEWIWQNRPFVTSRDIDRRLGTPAAFFAARAFDIPKDRDFVKVKIIADPQYTLWFNGTEIAEGGDRERSVLDAYDVSDLARTGPNLIVVAVRSSTGVGGLLLSVDLSPTRENVVVTDDSWRIYQIWREGLPAGNLRGLPWTTPRTLGRPPIGRWNYLTVAPAARRGSNVTVVYPVSSRSYRTALPQVRDISGTVVAISLPVPATAYDFGLIRGHGRIESKAPGLRIVHARYANDPSEFRGEGNLIPFVFAAGETSVTDPVERVFRYMIIYGENGASASVEQIQ